MSNIRKHITQIQEEKEIKQVSRVIVESRIKELIGGPDFFERYNKLSEDKKVVVSYQLFCELNELNSYGLIEEQDLWTSVIVSYLTSRPSELISSFRSCEAFSKLLSEAIIEAFVMELQQSSKLTNNMVVDFIRNSVGNSAKQFTDPLSKELSKTVCNFFSSLVKNIGGLQTKLAS
jgi:galactose-1-phosphate uridylyltransferase